MKRQYTEENDKEHDVRRIRQVYVSEEGDEKESLIPEESAGRERDEIYGSEHRGSAGRRAIRAIAVSIAMFFSLMLAMAVGVGLALWDSNRTVTELGSILLGREVAAATAAVPKAEEEPAKDPSGPAKDRDDADSPAGEDKDKGSEAVEEAETDGQEKDEASDEDSVPDDPSAEDDQEEAGDETPGDGDDEPAGVAGEALDAEAEWDEPAGYGSTLMSGSQGSDSVEKAGSDDEIVKEEDEADETLDADPTKDYPLPFTTVDESYFTDALFIGDSRLQGFGFWSGLPATYYCATGFQLYKYEITKVVQTENGKVPIFEALPYDAFTKIYIKVGLNELGYSEEAFENYYAQLIAQLREYEPRAIIYVHGLLPVTAEKSASDKVHNNANIAVRNEALKKFAESQKAYYLDAGPYLAAEDGSLRPEMTSDGIHLAAQYMKIWREYLCEHAVVID